MYRLIRDELDSDAVGPDVARLDRLSDEELREEATRRHDAARHPDTDVGYRNALIVECFREGVRVGHTRCG